MRSRDWSIWVGAVAFLLASGAEASRLIAGYGWAVPVNQQYVQHFSLNEVDPNTGSAVQIAELPARNWSDLAARSDDTGGVYATSRIGGAAFENRVSRIDVATGAVTDLYSFTPASLGLPASASFEFSGIAISPSLPSTATLTGTEILIQGSTVSFTTILFDLDLATGTRSALRTVSGIDIINDLARAPDASLFTYTSYNPRRLGVIDPTTAALTQIGSCQICTIRALDFDPANGGLFSIDVNGELMRLSVTTAEALQDIGPTGLGYVDPGAAVWGMAFVVPEPDTGVLVTLGLGALAQRRRGRSQPAS